MIMDYDGKFIMQKTVDWSLLNDGFTKHKHWEHENEYRIVCKGVEFLDISKAITGIYALEDSKALKQVNKLVTDESLVYLLRQEGIGNYQLTATNLKLINSFIDMF